MLKRLRAYHHWVWGASLFIVALLPRITHLNQFLTTDEPFNIFIAGGDVIKAFLAGNFRQTYWHFYPGVTMSWVEAFGFGADWLRLTLSSQFTSSFNQYLQQDIRILLTPARLPYAVLTALLVAGCYILLRRWFATHIVDNSHYLALLAALFIAFDPFFLAHSRVAHGDAPVAVFMTLGVLTLFLYIQTGQFKHLVLSAISGALAALTKAPGQFMAVFVILVLGGDWLWQCIQLKHLNLQAGRQRLLAIVWWGSIAFITFFVLWPAMWVDPFGTLQQMLNETFGKVDEGHLVFFFGQPTTNPGPWFYPYVILFRLTPLTSLGLAFSIGFILYYGLKYRWQQVEAKRDSSQVLFPIIPAALLWFFVISLLLFANLSAKKQDRYLLPLFPILDILAAIGWVGLWQLVLIYWQPLQRIKIIGVMGLIILQMILVLPWHPYYLAYFNPLLGGLDRAVETTLVGWGEGMEQVAAYLNQKPNAENLYVATTPSQTLLPYFKGHGENFYTNDVALRADYVVIYRAQQQRLAPSPEIVRTYLDRQPEKVIEIKGVPYAWIYPNTPVIFQDIPPNATLSNIGFGRIMRLAGYQLQTEVNTMTINLVWHALPPITDDRGPCYETIFENEPVTICPRMDYTISVRLLTIEGEVVAQHDSWPVNGLLPTSQWRVNDYIQDNHPLPLPADLLPGQYTLAVVVYQTDSGTVLAGPIDVATVDLP